MAQEARYYSHKHSEYFDPFLFIIFVFAYPAATCPSQAMAGGTAGNRACKLDIINALTGFNTFHTLSLTIAVAPLFPLFSKIKFPFSILTIRYVVYIPRPGLLSMKSSFEKILFSFFNTEFGKPLP